MKRAPQVKDRSHLLNVLIFLALLIFIVIAVYVYVYPENSFDRYIQEQTRPLATPGLLSFWIHISFFGSFAFLFPAWLIFIVISVWQRKVLFGLSVAGVAIGSFLSVQILKQIFQRHRPVTPLIPNMIEYSFPSGHSTSSFIFCAVLTYSICHGSVYRSVNIAGIILLTMLMLCIGLSRIVLNVHYPTDVAAGFCLGGLWIFVWYRFVKKKI